MSEKNNSIQMFEDRQIRTAWNAEQEEWYFSVTDVIAVLTDSADPNNTSKKCVPVTLSLTQGGYNLYPNFNGSK